MKGILASLIILVSFSNSAWGQTADEMRGMWQRTGYGFAELMQEEDFSVDFCESNSDYFSACLMALYTILSSVEDQTLVLKFNGADSIEIVSLTEEDLPKTYEEYMAFDDSLRADFALAYEMGLRNSFESLLRQVNEVALENIPVESQAYVAGRAYNTLLQQAYDPHSTLIPREAQIPTPNEFFGIGATVAKILSEESSWTGALSLEPMAGSPASQAGLKKGDLVLKVDGIDISNDTPSEAVEKIKGPEGSVVSLEVRRICTGEVETVDVTRGPIVNFPDWTKDSRFVSLNSSNERDVICSGQTNEPQAGEPQALYVPLTGFIAAQGHDLCTEFINLQLRDLRNPDSVGMIIDLRNNRGGSLDAVACMLDTVINDDGLLVGQVPVRRGEIVLGAQAGRSYMFTRRPTVRLTNGASVIYNKNIVVLVNGNSASASEIFAGTIQDMQRGFIVGEQTYGKGSVQSYRNHYVSSELRSPSDQPLMLGRTTAIYTLNSGRSPQNFGILPDFAYTNLGEVPEERGDSSGEAGRFRTIQFDNNQWEQTRPEVVADIEGCAQAGESQTQNYLQNLREDESYSFPFVANFQLEMAKDVLRCAPQRDVVENIVMAH